MQSYSRLGNLFGLGQKLPGASFTEQAAALPTNVAVPGATFTPNAARGACSPDGNFVWDYDASGNGYWRSKRVGEQCTEIATVAPPTVSHGPGGGVTVTQTASYRTRQAQFEQLMTQRTGAQMQALAALAPLLPGCPPSSQKKAWPSSGTDPGKPCYLAPTDPILEDMMLAPGSFSLHDVVFNAAEVSDGYFQKMFVPTDQQKLLFAWEVIRTSADVLRGISQGSSVERALREHDD